jgi:hypothetical protein
MSKYVRLSHEISLPDGSLPEFSPPFATEYELNPTTRWGKVRAPKRLYIFILTYCTSAAAIMRAASRHVVVYNSDLAKGVALKGLRL